MTLERIELSELKLFEGRGEEKKKEHRRPRRAKKYRSYEELKK